MRIMSVSTISISRNLVLLNDENRFTRKNALTTIKKELLEFKDSEFISCEVSNLLVSRIPDALNDNTECNRELVVEILNFLLEKIENVSELLPGLFHVLVNRLGQKNVIEHSEELRLSILNILYKLICDSVDLSAFVDDCFLILQHTFVDHYHEIKKLSCQIITKLALKKYHRFYQSSEIILPQILSNLIHQHCKVRDETVRALKIFMLHSQGKLVDNVILPLTQRLFDTSSLVRFSVIDLVGSWLLDLTDRYSYHTKLLPLLLTGLIDESKEICEITQGLWHDIGLKFEKENEEQLKDKLDFDKGTLYNYPFGHKRNNLGCRELIHRSASRLLPALCRDLLDWQEETRSKAAGLIPIIILHLEESTSQHTQHLIIGIASGLADAVNRIASSANCVALLQLIPEFVFYGDLYIKNNFFNLDCLIPKMNALARLTCLEINEAIKTSKQLAFSAQLMGCFIKSRIWWRLLEPCLNRCTESNAPSSLAGHLYLLAGLLDGTPIDQLVDISESDLASHGLLHDIVTYLSQNELISALSPTTKAALYQCTVIIIKRICHAHVHIFRPVNDSRTCEEYIRIFKLDQMASSCILDDFDMRCSLFQIILGLGSMWSNNEMKSSEFGHDFMGFINKIMHALIHIQKHCSQYLDKIDLSTCCDRLSDADLLQFITHEERNRAFAEFIPMLLNRLTADLDHSGSWRPNCVSLAIFSRCLELAGPALLICFDDLRPSIGIGKEDQSALLTKVLNLLQRGCRLDCAPNADKSPGTTDPLTMVGEAELRQRGLIILTQLTDDGSIRHALSSTTYLDLCLTKLVLPVCVWRAGRTSEAMRKTAVTCLVALLASSSAVSDLDQFLLQSRLTFEVDLDQWLCDHLDGLKKLIGFRVHFVDHSFDQLNISEDTVLVDRRTSSSLTMLSSSTLSLLLGRLGSLLDDDLEGTRRMACLGLTLLFNSLVSSSPLPNDNDNNNHNSMLHSNEFLNSPTWLVNPTMDSSRPTPNMCPMPNSFGDQVYRFYPNLIKRLNDAKDSIRILSTETIISWYRLLLPMLTNYELVKTKGNGFTQSLNPTYSSVIREFTDSVLIHLDDQNSEIRVSVARIIARIGYINCEQTIEILEKAKDRHRSAYLCNQLIHLIRSNL